MLKWYEKEGKESDIVIASKIKLSRNLKNYPFSPKMTNENAKQLINEVFDNIPNFNNENTQFLKCNVNLLDENNKEAMIEKDIISSVLANKKQDTALIMTEDENINIMINEDDHIKIQVFEYGMEIDNAFNKANKIDDIAYDLFEFAYNEKYGYLTTCPTNIGTGLRASYIVFLPALLGANKVQQLSEEAGKYNIELKKLYETSGLYQISNQKTLGISEKEIIENLNSITLQIIKQERKRREYILENNYEQIEDKVYRSYGVLKYARNISNNDAMMLLSQLKFGIDMNIIKMKENINIFKLMLDIQPAVLQCKQGMSLRNTIRDKARANYINNSLPELL